MPLSSALRFLSVWSGSMAFAESRPVDVCLQTIYGLNSGVFPSTLLHCLILTVAWFGALSRVRLRHTTGLRSTNPMYGREDAR